MLITKPFVDNIDTRLSLFMAEVIKWKLGSEAKQTQILPVCVSHTTQNFTSSLYIKPKNLLLVDWQEEETTEINDAKNTPVKEIPTPEKDKEDVKPTEDEEAEMESEGVNYGENIPEGDEDKYGI